MCVCVNETKIGFIFHTVLNYNFLLSLWNAVYQSFWEVCRQTQGHSFFPFLVCNCLSSASPFTTIKYLMVLRLIVNKRYLSNSITDLCFLFSFSEGTIMTGCCHVMWLSILTMNLITTGVMQLFIGRSRYHCRPLWLQGRNRGITFLLIDWYDRTCIFILSPSAWFFHQLPIFPLKPLRNSSILLTPLTVGVEANNCWT
jgi:hypothetical protein